MKEAVYIWASKPSLNRNCRRYNLPPFWNNIIKERLTENGTGTTTGGGVPGLRNFVSVPVCLHHHLDMPPYWQRLQLQLKALELLSGEGFNIASVLCPVPFHVKWNKICLNQSSSKCQTFFPMLYGYNMWKVMKNKMFDLIWLQKKKFDWMRLWEKIVRHVMLKEMKCLPMGGKT